MIINTIANTYRQRCLNKMICFLINIIFSCKNYNLGIGKSILPLFDSSHVNEYWYSDKSMRIDTPRAKYDEIMSLNIISQNNNTLILPDSPIKITSYSIFIFARRNKRQSDLNRRCYSVWSWNLVEIDQDNTVKCNVGGKKLYPYANVGTYLSWLCFLRDPKSCWKWCKDKQRLSHVVLWWVTWIFFSSIQQVSKYPYKQILKRLMSRSFCSNAL